MRALGCQQTGFLIGDIAIFPGLRRREALAAPERSWAHEELAEVDLPDGRLRTRLVRLAEVFFAHPTDPIGVAMHGDAGQTKAAYRFLKNPQVNLQTLLHPYYEATVRRIAAHPRVLSVQDTTSLSYDAHPATRGLGPINTRRDGAQGLKLLHDTPALTPEGVPLGLIIEDRRLADAESLEACLALDLVVAWRVMHLAKLGRESPAIPCSAENPYKTYG